MEGTALRVVSGWRPAALVGIGHDCEGDIMAGSVSEGAGHRHRGAARRVRCETEPNIMLRKGHKGRD